MGWSSGLKLRDALSNLARILAVELASATLAVEMRAPLRPGVGTGTIVATVRETVLLGGPDRWLAPELAAAERLVHSGRLQAAAGGVVGPLA
jgi:histidine ammonia-lyase